MIQSGSSPLSPFSLGRKLRIASTSSFLTESGMFLRAIGVNSVTRSFTVTYVRPLFVISSKKYNKVRRSNRTIKNTLAVSLKIFSPATL